MQPGRTVAESGSTTLEERATRRRGPGGRWWRWSSLLGLVLLLVPALALVVTNRDPDPLFLHRWWTPVASVPTDTLALGSLGLTVLLATGLALVLTVPLRRHGLHRVLGLGLVVALTGAAVVASLGVAAARAHVSEAAVRAVLLRQEPSTGLSVEARRAFELALGWPAATAAGVQVIPESTVPAGPWLVQSVEVRNQDLSDENADVQVGTLVDPLTGRIEAAWFFGL